ncbi:hypothetical protein FZ934_23055 (plasmid) [Rhizobium grahamii]|uniref:Uncharacterized protein n=1 Tax=Rhizobium grahamii TaxID=1120045 RepID=A0A5Q0CFI4_9HYPH|nr:hypothetical protein FZ934_23055 [Rhizobium grahamii]QRM53048.1 hypothetical protein F3Y33_22595 [Rhizobium sp. BG6]
MRNRSSRKIGRQHASTGSNCFAFASVLADPGGSQPARLSSFWSDAAGAPVQSRLPSDRRIRYGYDGAVCLYITAVR